MTHTSTATFYAQLFLSMTVGLALGALGCVVGQKQLNKIAVNTCNAQPDYHRLVSLSSWVGDAKYCIHARYLSN